MKTEKLGIGDASCCDKRIAQPEIDLQAQPRIQSRRGVGYKWKMSTGDDMPTLFGAGGEQDGVSAMIQTNANVQREDEAALHGMGDEAIDSNRFQRNQANANTEFNFSQYKSGALRTFRGKALPGEGLFSITNTDGLYSGDTTILVDPYSSVVDVTSQAVGNLFGGVYKSTGSTMDEHSKHKLGANPFEHKVGEAKKEEKVTTEEVDPTAEIEEEDGTGINYYYENAYYDGDAAVKQTNDDYKTGLRRVNTKTSQGRQLDRVATKEHIMAAYQEANDTYATILKNTMGKSYLDPTKKQEALEILRPTAGKFRTAQMGVNMYSGKQHRVAMKDKTSTTKLNTLLVGV